MNFTLTAIEQKVLDCLDSQKLSIEETAKLLNINPTGIEQIKKRYDKKFYYAEKEKLSVELAKAAREHKLESHERENETLKIMVYTLQSLGYYAEIADYKVSKGLGAYYTEQFAYVLLTNASKADVLEIFPAVPCDYDDEDAEMNDVLNDSGYDYVWHIVDFYQMDWSFPESVNEDESDKDLIKCHFFDRCAGGADYNEYINIKCNQPPARSRNC